MKVKKTENKNFPYVIENNGKYLHAEISEKTQQHDWKDGCNRFDDFECATFCKTKKCAQYLMRQAREHNIK